MKDLKKIFSRRSFIFTPPLKKTMFGKAISSGVDIVCLELEDGIAPSDKTLARERALDIINTQKYNDNVEVLIRVNSIRESCGLLDITAILNSKIQPDGLLIPKVKRYSSDKSHDTSPSHCITRPYSWILSRSALFAFLYGP